MILKWPEQKEEALTLLALQGLGKAGIDETVAIKHRCQDRWSHPTAVTQNLDGALLEVDLDSAFQVGLVYQCMCPSCGRNLQVTRYARSIGGASIVWGFYSPAGGYTR